MKKEPGGNVYAFLRIYERVRDGEVKGFVPVMISRADTPDDTIIAEIREGVPDLADDEFRLSNSRQVEDVGRTLAIIKWTSELNVGGQFAADVLSTCDCIDDIMRSPKSNYGVVALSCTYILDSLCHAELIVWLMERVIQLDTRYSCLAKVIEYLRYVIGDVVDNDRDLQAAIDRLSLLFEKYAGKFDGSDDGKTCDSSELPLARHLYLAALSVVRLVNVHSVGRSKINEVAATGALFDMARVLSMALYIAANPGRDKNAPVNLANFINPLLREYPGVYVYNRTSDIEKSIIYRT